MAQSLDAACDACDLRGEGGIPITPHQMDVDEERRMRGMQNAWPIFQAGIQAAKPSLPYALAQNVLRPKSPTYAGGYRGSRFSSRDMKRKTFHAPPGDPPPDQGCDERTPLGQMLADRY